MMYCLYSVCHSIKKLSRFMVFPSLQGSSWRSKPSKGKGIWAQIAQARASRSSPWENKTGLSSEIAGETKGCIQYKTEITTTIFLEWDQPDRKYYSFLPWFLGVYRFLPNSWIFALCAPIFHYVHYANFLYELDYSGWTCQLGRSLADIMN